MVLTKIIMGMPITVEVVDAGATSGSINKIFDFFKSVDEKFSTYKEQSEISKINRGEIKPENYSLEIKEVFSLAEQTKKETKGYFDIFHNNTIDPSGLVKGWAIQNAADILASEGFKDFYVEAGGDIQTFGKNSSSEKWKIGIKNPFNQKEIVKVVNLSGQGIATSGDYIRGQHIYNPVDAKVLDEIASISVIAKNVYEADRFATAAFAMGKDGINFIESKPGLEGYAIDKDGIATMSSNFENFTKY